MLMRDTSGLSGAGGAAYQTDADFFIAPPPAVAASLRRCGGAFSSCLRAIAAPAHDVAQLRTAAGNDADDVDQTFASVAQDSPRRNSSMSARNVLGRSGNWNGNDVVGDDVGDAGDPGMDDDDGVRFTRSVHTSFMAHCRFCLLTNESGLAVVPIGELRAEQTNKTNEQHENTSAPSSASPRRRSQRRRPFERLLR